MGGHQDPIRLPLQKELIAWFAEPDTATPADVRRMIALIGELQRISRDEQNRLLARIYGMRHDDYARTLGSVIALLRADGNVGMVPAVEYARMILRGDDPNAAG